MLGISIGFNSRSTHNACTAIFVAVAAVIGFSCGSIQTLGKVSWIAWVGVFGILTAVFSLTVAVGVQDRPAEAPQTGVYHSDYKLFGEPTFAEAMSAVSTIVFAFAGAPAFFSIASEMRNPRDYTKSLVIAQGVVSLVYLIIGVVVYYFCGSYVASPALGSAGPTMKKVCYGIALPGLVASCMLFVHLPAKSFFMRFMRTSRHLTANTPIHWAAWVSCTGGITVVAYLIGSGIPVFDGLISLVGAVFATLMMFQPMGFMWLYDNWHKDRNAKWKAAVAWERVQHRHRYIHHNWWYLWLGPWHHKLEGPNSAMVLRRQLQFGLRESCGAVQQWRCKKHAVEYLSPARDLMISRARPVRVDGHFRHRPASEEGIARSQSSNPAELKIT